MLSMASVLSEHDQCLSFEKDRSVGPRELLCYCHRRNVGKGNLSALVSMPPRRGLSSLLGIVWRLHELQTDPSAKVTTDPSACKGGIHLRRLGGNSLISLRPRKSRAFVGAQPFLYSSPVRCVS